MQAVSEQKELDASQQASQLLTLREELTAAQLAAEASDMALQKCNQRLEECAQQLAAAEERARFQAASAATAEQLLEQKAKELDSVKEQLQECEGTNALLEEALASLRAGLIVEGAWHG